MNGDLLSRRRFVTGASGLTAAVLLAPEAIAGQGAQAAEPARRQVRRGRCVGRPRPARDHALDARGRRRGHRHRRGPGGPRPRLPQGRGPRLHQGERLDRPLREGARGRPAALRGVLLPLRDPRRAEPRRPLPHRAPARLEPAGALRVLLLPGLHVRLLQRPRAPGEGGPRLRGLPRRLHLRRGLLPGGAHRRRPRRPGRRRPRRSTSTGPSTPRTGPTRTCGASMPASR